MKRKQPNKKRCRYVPSDVKFSGQPPTPLAKIRGDTERTIIILDEVDSPLIRAIDELGISSSVRRKVVSAPRLQGFFYKRSP